MVWSDGPASLLLLVLVLLLRQRELHRAHRLVAADCARYDSIWAATMANPATAAALEQLGSLVASFRRRCPQGLGHLRQRLPQWSFQPQPPSTVTVESVRDLEANGHQRPNEPGRDGSAAAGSNAVVEEGGQMPAAAARPDHRGPARLVLRGNTLAAMRRAWESQEPHASPVDSLDQLFVQVLSLSHPLSHSSLLTRRSSCSPGPRPFRPIVPPVLSVCICRASTCASHRAYVRSRSWPCDFDHRSDPPGLIRSDSCRAGLGHWTPPTGSGSGER